MSPPSDPGFPTAEVLPYPQVWQPSPPRTVRGSGAEPLIPNTAIPGVASPGNGGTPKNPHLYIETVAPESTVGQHLINASIHLVT